MSTPPKSPESAAALRQRAEAAFQEKAAALATAAAPQTPEAARALLHDLQVHQIELELQNEELRRAQAELDVSRTRYFDLYDLAPVGYCTVSETGLIREANLALATQLGVARGALVTQPFSRFIHKEDADSFYLLRKQLLATGRPQTCELQMAPADGSQFWAQLAATVAPADDGPPGLRVVLSDLTERKQVELAQQESARQLQEVIESMDDGITVSDRTGHFEIFNPAMREITGYAIEEANGTRDFASLIYPDSKEHQAVFDELKEIVTGGGIHRVETVMRAKDGSRKVLFVSTSLFNFKNQRMFLSVYRDITGRKQAEEALRMFQFASDQAADAVFWLDQNAGFYYVNDQACRSLGYTREELMRLSLFDIDPFVSRENWEADWKRLRDKQIETLRMESRHRCKDGSVFPIELMVKHSCFGGIELHLAFVRDMTERKRMEANLAAERALLRNLVDHLPLAVYLKDTAGRKTLANPMDLRNFGVTSEAEVLGKTDNDFFPPEQAAAFHADDQQVLDGQPVFNREEKLTRPDGTKHWLLTSKVPLRDATGKVTGLAGFGLDITGRKQTEETIIRLAMAVEQSAETIVITNADGTIIYVNPAFEKSTGYPRAEALGQNPRIFKSGKHDAGFYRQMWDVLERGEVWHGRFINQRKDGTLYEEEAAISPVRDASGKVVNYVAVKRDMTREMQLEVDLRQSQKMEAFGQLAGGVAHDFNNILAVIQLQAGLLKAEPGFASKHLEYARDIELASQRGANLTRQLLLFSRKQTMQPQNLKLNEVVDNMTKMLQRTLGEQVQLQFKYAEEPLIIHADPGMIDQILLNLTVNARDAMPQGGQIIIETTAAEFDEVTAPQSPQARPGSFVCLSVSDTGSGIPPEILPRIFEPFFTTKDVGKGTGLGLATVFGIVQQHQGWIDVYSEVGRGTTFQVYLPRAAKTSDAEYFWSSRTSMQGGKETILLAEDEVALRAVVRTALSRLGYRVLEAASGEEALAVWKQHRDEIRLLLTDLVMPGGMSGKELAGQLLQQNPKLKVIYASGYSVEVAGKDLLLEEGVNFLAKPFQTSKLAQTIRKCLDRD